MGCFSCLKPSTSEDTFEAETDIVKQVSSYDALVQEEEDEQVALAIQKSQQEEEERRRRTRRDLEEEHALETQHYDNSSASSSSSLKDKQDGQTSEEKDKTKQFEEQLAVIPPPPPPPLEDNNNISSRAPLDDEQRIIRESLKEKGQTKPPSEDDDNGKLVEVIPPRSMCGGCHFEIEHGGSCVDVLGVPWHPECFSCAACHIPFAINEVQNHVSNSRGKFHKACYDRYCYVCKEKVKTKMFEYHKHHFWEEKYCPAHDSDGTPKCCSCERLEPTDFVKLDDGRWLCLECMESAVMDTYEAHNLHLEIREFFLGLNMKIEKEFPLLLVEKQALNKAEEEEKIENRDGEVTRGICLSEVQMVTSVAKGPKMGPNKQLEGKATESQWVESGCPVTAILILYGLPRLLTGSLMAHEMMHAYLRLKGYNNLNKVQEEGLCQVLGHMWLETQRYAPIDVAAAASSSSSSSNAAKKGEWSEFEKRLVAFYKNEIETDDSAVYGEGFRKVNNMVTNSSLPETLNEIVRRQG